MTEANTLLEQAARCRRIARICTSAAIAQKFEALAQDYEEHARLLGKSNPVAEYDPTLELREPRSA